MPHRTIDTQTPDLIAHVEDGVATITMNRPDRRNALSGAMLEALARVLEECETATDIAAVLLTGSGGAFCAGGDVKGMAESHATGQPLDIDTRIHRQRLSQRNTAGRLYQMPKPTIAAIPGAAAGAGLSLALACDLRIAADTARLGVPVARTLGNCLSVENLARLVDLVGQGRALELMFTGRLVPAAEALAWGLVHRVVPAADLDAETRTLAGELASRATSTLATTKAMLRRLRAARRPAPGDCDDLIAACYASADFREGVAAFAAKRRPSFS